MRVGVGAAIAPGGVKGGRIETVLRKGLGKRRPKGLARSRKKPPNPRTMPRMTK